MKGRAVTGGGHPQPHDGNQREEPQERDTRRVTLVCGPPCAGKTTYVLQHADPGDLVLDQDQVARELGSECEWLHTRATSMRANRRMRGAMVGVGNARSGTSWVIRCQPNGRKRRSLAFSIRATSVIVIKPPIEVVLERAQHRPDPDRTARLVRDWYAKYTVAIDETCIPGFGQDWGCCGPA